MLQRVLICRHSLVILHTFTQSSLIAFLAPRPASPSYGQSIRQAGPIRYKWLYRWVQSLLFNFARLLVASGLMVSQFLIAAFLQIKYSLHPFLYIRKKGSVIPNFANALQEWLFRSTSLMRIHLKFVFYELLFVVSMKVHSITLWGSFTILSIRVLTNK